MEDKAIENYGELEAGYGCDMAPRGFCWKISRLELACEMQMHVQIGLHRHYIICLIPGFSIFLSTWQMDFLFQNHDIPEDWVPFSPETEWRCYQRSRWHSVRWCWPWWHRYRYHHTFHLQMVSFQTKQTGKNVQYCISVRSRGFCLSRPERSTFPWSHDCDTI